MKREKLQDAIGMVGDDLIAEASECLAGLST